MFALAPRAFQSKNDLRYSSGVVWHNPFFPSVRPEDDRTVYQAWLYGQDRKASPEPQLVWSGIPDCVAPLSAGFGGFVSCLE